MHYKCRKHTFRFAHAWAETENWWPTYHFVCCKCGHENLINQQLFWTGSNL